MGWASEAAIAEHNLLMETDAEYAGAYLRHCEEAAYYHLWLIETEVQAEFFGDYRLSHDGYEEFDVPGLDVQTVGVFEDKGLPF